MVMNVMVLSKPSRYDMADAEDHTIHINPDCQAILARTARGFDPSDYETIDLDRVENEVLACQFCFEGLPDAWAVKNSLLASIYAAL
jgi:hypothetical protein